MCLIKNLNIKFLVFRKDSKNLGEQYKKGIPIEVLPIAFQPIKNKIKEILGGEAVLRMAKMKAVS